MNSTAAMQTLAVLLLIALTGFLLYAMRRGWRRREQKIAVEELPELPVEGPGGGASTHGIYVTTTLAGQPFERIVAQGLGLKSAIDVYVRADGVYMERQGASDIFVPLRELRQVTTTHGMVGKFAAPDSIIVLQWTLGNRDVDTGIHIRSAQERQHLLEHLQGLVGNKETA